MTETTKLRPARAIADLTEGTILASVEIAAPPERVFQAITSDEVTKWWGSADTYRTTEWQADLRVGGQWRAGGKGQDGQPFSVGGEYLEIDPPRKLVQTWKPDWDAPHVTTLTYHLDAIAGGTRVTVRHIGFVGRPERCQGHSEGWERVLGWLGGHFPAAAPAGAGGKFFLCKLIAPRATFPGDMTPQEGQVMQEHVGYWTGMMKKGHAVVFGPVADPSGVWGLGVLEVASESQLHDLIAQDPVVRAAIGFRFETYPMLRAIRP